MAENQGSKVFGNFIWRFAERCGAQLVGFMVSVVLARIIDPKEFGSLALITVFTTILQVFVDSGLGNALIQKKDADNIDFSTVFYTNVVFCVLLYLLAFLAAPFIAEYYNDTSLTWPIRILSLTVLISGVKNVQQAYISRHFIFKKFFFSTLGGTLFAAVLGITMALKGYGVWALVAQQVSNLFIGTVILWITVKWRPEKVFSFERLKGLFSFGWKLLASRLLDTIYNNVRSLIIGKMYSSTDLAYYNRANQMPHLIVNNINLSIDSVLFPSLSQEQDNIDRVRAMTRRAIKTSVYVMAPLMMGLAFTAEPVIKVVLTEKWLPSVPYLVIFSIIYMFYPIHTANLKAIVALGRSDLNLKLEVEKKVVGFALLFSTMWFGVMAMAYSLLAASFLSQLINSRPNKKLLNYGYKSQFLDILPSILLAGFMGICVFPIKHLPLPTIVVLVIQVTVGAAIYILGSKIVKIDSYDYMKGILLEFLKRKKQAIAN